MEKASASKTFMGRPVSSIRSIEVCGLQAVCLDGSDFEGRLGHIRLGHSSKRRTQNHRRSKKA